MKCDEFERDHLESCPTCRDFSWQDRNPPRPSTDLEGRLFSELERISPWRRILRWRIPAWQAAAALLVVFFLPRFSQQAPEPEPPGEVSPVTILENPFWEGERESPGGSFLAGKEVYVEIGE